MFFRMTMMMIMMMSFNSKCLNHDALWEPLHLLCLFYEYFCLIKIMTSRRQGHTYGTMTLKHVSTFMCIVNNAWLAKFNWQMLIHAYVYQGYLELLTLYINYHQYPISHEGNGDLKLKNNPRLIICQRNWATAQ